MVCGGIAWPPYWQRGACSVMPTTKSTAGAHKTRKNNKQQDLSTQRRLHAWIAFDLLQHAPAVAGDVGRARTRQHEQARKVVRRVAVIKSMRFRYTFV